MVMAIERHSDNHLTKGKTMYDSNVYYSPEKFGLEEVGQIEWSEPDYSFDTTVVWKDEEGNFYQARDSGCSCPSPFEDLTREELKPETVDEICAGLQAELEDSYSKDYASAQVFELISRLRK